MMKKIVIFSFAAAFLFISLTVVGTAEGYPAGSLIEFGEYPQTHVTEAALVSELDACLAADNWQSLGFYCGDGTYGSMAPSDFAKYQDVEYNGSKYRAITFSAYRPVYSKNPCGEAGYIGSVYGYKTEEIHWFSFDPIEWKVLDAETGLLCSTAILDSRALNDIVAVCERNGSASVYYLDAEKNYYANNYAQSTLRSWLNGEFFNTAFSDAEKACIAVSEVDNSFDAYGDTEYVCENTFDRIFIPGAPELFVDEYFPDNASLMKKATDYAKAAGIASYTASDVKEYDFWLLRTTAGDSNINTYIREEGIYSAGCNADSSDFGTVPMLCADLEEIAKLPKEPAGADPYEGFTFDFADGVLMIGGSGILPEAPLSGETPLAEYSGKTTAAIIDSGITGISQNAFRNFSGLKMLVCNGDTHFETESLANLSALTTVICCGNARFGDNAFAADAKGNIYFLGESSVPDTLPDGGSSHSVTFADGTLRISGSVALDYYTFLDTISVFCSVYDNVNEVHFDGFTSGSIYFRHINESTGKEEVIRGETLTDTAFRVSVSTGSGEEFISFNELCRRAGEGTLKEFRLAVVSEEYEDMEENIIQLLERQLMRALKWIVGLLNAIFNLFTKLTK